MFECNKTITQVDVTLDISVRLCHSSQCLKRQCQVGLGSVRMCVAEPEAKPGGGACRGVQRG